MKRSKISVAIATFNEEKNIVDCLESAKQISKDIVVVDGNSTDRTAEIAKNKGARVIKRTNVLMFNINKNIAIKNCQGDWVFVIDADERISEDLAKEINGLLSKKTDFDGYWVKRKNWFLGGYLTKGGAYPDFVLRLFKKKNGKFPQKDVHEQVSVQGKIGYLNEDLLHLADPSFERYLIRANRYSTHTALAIKEKNPGKGIVPVVYYMIIKPIFTFASIFIRHKGYKDGFRGFVWALFSGVHYYFAYVKYWEKDKFSSSN